MRTWLEGVHRLLVAARHVEVSVGRREAHRDVEPRDRVDCEWPRGGEGEGDQLALR